jgi:hypothetical protein
VDGEDRHRSLEGAVIERQRLGGGVHGGGQPGATSGPHRPGRFDGGESPVKRLVRTGARADVEDRPGAAERSYDRGRDARVRSPVLRIPCPDPAVVCVAGAPVRVSHSRPTRNVRDTWLSRRRREISIRGILVNLRGNRGARSGEAGHTFTPTNPLVAENKRALDRGRRIDYVFVRCEDSLYGPTLDIRACPLAFDEPVGGVWASGHFGVVAGLSVPDVCS